MKKEGEFYSFTKGEKFLQSREIIFKDKLIVLIATTTGLNVRQIDINPKKIELNPKGETK